MRAVAAAIRAAVARRRVQSLVVGVVLLLSTGTAVLGVGLLVVSQDPFDNAFARLSGAHATATFDADKVGADALAGTATRSGVTAAAGPFDTVLASLQRPNEPEGRSGPPVVIAGRAEQNGPVDKLSLDSGHWLTGPGQIVLARGSGPISSSVTLDLPGSPSLRVVGVAHSITGTASAWVWPTQDDVLHAQGAMTGRQMLYRFASAADQTAVQKSVDSTVAGLPAGALRDAQSYLTSKNAADTGVGPMVPFVVAFAVLGLVMSVLIVANVVSGAVVAGYRIIGVLKSLGFTPRQVVAVYAGQVLAPALVGCLLGVPLGNALAMPLLGEAQEAYGAEASAILPPWVNVTVVLVLLALVGAAAVAPAWRAGGLAAVQAISVGRAPRNGRGYHARRALARTRLPRPVSFGLGTPFARPARSVATLLAVLVGAITVVFAVGLTSSLNRVVDAFGRSAQVPIAVGMSGVVEFGGPMKSPASGESPRADPATVRAAIEAQPGTAKVMPVRTVQVPLAGVEEPIAVIGYGADASWLGFELVSGRWYAGADEVVAGSHLLRVTGRSVGDTLTVTSGVGQRRLRVVGQVFARENGGFALYGADSVLTGLTTETRPDSFEVGLKPGTDATSYANKLAEALEGQSVHVEVRDEEFSSLAIMRALVATLTLVLAVVAALGVFNTAVLNTRERTHEIGVLKSVGMTPRQVRTMVIASVAGIGLVAGLIAVPLGYALHGVVLPVMGDAAQTDLPRSVLDVYHPGPLAVLALAGVLLAVVGAMVPAGWAARSGVATALRSE
ncbi:ABC transporter permease [Phytohabitans rumicis]|uniref:ABC3 transporter permease C-terminal domain-containing protein n=1 Tax=Phytohabitans rumicis TaxID=1076125 RepID=A0A6V8LHQ5_9ACTN|nr:ABC transporter permease [Phytohabitans rumicis]GFJ94159.1 hypothetical protein Prum_078010 [Phytohabitans rumicis]